jgi:hypothetical protein
MLSGQKLPATVFRTPGSAMPHPLSHRFTLSSREGEELPLEGTPLPQPLTSDIAKMPHNPGLADLPGSLVLAGAAPRSEWTAPWWARWAGRMMGMPTLSRSTMLALTLLGSVMLLPAPGHAQGSARGAAVNSLETQTMLDRRLLQAAEDGELEQIQTCWSRGPLPMPPTAADARR